MIRNGITSKKSVRGKTIVPFAFKKMEMIHCFLEASSWNLAEAKGFSQTAHFLLWTYQGNE